MHINVVGLVTFTHLVKLVGNFAVIEPFTGDRVPLHQFSSNQCAAKIRGYQAADVGGLHQITFHLANVLHGGGEFWFNNPVADKAFLVDRDKINLGRK